MKPTGKLPAIVAALLALTCGGYLLAGAYVYRLGAVSISVIEKRPGGEHVRLFVPGAAITPSLNLIPENTWKEKSRDLQPWLPVVRKAARALEGVADGVLVEVESPEARVNVAKHTSALVIDVDTPEESVHVSVPLPLVESVAEKLQIEAPAG